MPNGPTLTLVLTAAVSFGGCADGGESGHPDGNGNPANTAKREADSRRATKAWTDHIKATAELQASSVLGEVRKMRIDEVRVRGNGPQAAAAYWIVRDDSGREEQNLVTGEVEQNKQGRWEFVSGSLRDEDVPGQ